MIQKLLNQVSKNKTILSEFHLLNDNRKHDSKDKIFQDISKADKSLRELEKFREVIEGSSLFRGEDAQEIEKLICLSKENIKK